MTAITMSTPGKGLTMMSLLALASGLAVAFTAPAPARAAATNASAAPTCTTSQLRGSIGAVEGGAGSVFTTLILRNVGDVCSVYGFPGVSLVAAAGRQIGFPARRQGAGVPIRYVILLHNGAASTILRTLNPGVGTTNCLPPSVGLRVYPPNRTAALFVPVRLSYCLHSFDVRPLTAGTTGQ